MVHVLYALVRVKPHPGRYIIVPEYKLFFYVELKYKKFDIFIVYLIMQASVQKELSKHIGEFYSRCVGLLDIKKVELTEEEINIILAKKKDWSDDPKLHAAIKKIVADNNDFETFEKVINDIALIMIEFHNIYHEYRGETISTKRSYRYATDAYKKIYPQQMELFEVLVLLRERDITYKEIGLCFWVTLSLVVLIIITGICAILYIAK